MEREERIRHQKEFLIKFAYWAVWGGLVLAAVKMIGPVLLPFIAAFFVAWILSFPVAFAAERMHIRRRIAAVAVVQLFYGLAGPGRGASDRNVRHPAAAGLRHCGKYSGDVL